MSGEKIKILDGSYGSQLNKHLEKHLDDDPLWSSKALITNTEAVVKTHMDYIQAGVDIIETNTYQASVDGFMKYLGISRDESIKLIERAVELARTAISNCEKMGCQRPSIAGSIGPYGAFLHDGSEYTGSYMDFVTDGELREYHEPRVDALVRAGVDLLAIETIPSAKEAAILVDIAKRYPQVKMWVSFSCKTDGLSTAYGDNFASTAVEIYESNPDQIIAVGVNCIAPHAVDCLLRNINACRDPPIPLIVYANSGGTYDVKSGWDNNLENLVEYIPTWLNLGVKIIGGCCRVCSNDIEKIRDEVIEWEKQHEMT